MSSSESSTKPSPKTVIADARRIAEQRAAKTQPREVVEDRFQALTSTNVFAQIMLNPALSPEAKQEALVKVLTFSKDSTKVENRAKLEAFGVFKEYLQEQRKLLNREGIKLQDTEAFAELQSVIDEMTKSSIEFQDRVKPLLEVLNAVFEIRKHDKITDVYREIQSDKAWQEEQAKVLAQLQEELGEQNRTLDALDREKARLAVDRTLFGLGVVRKSSRERIAMIDGVERVAVSKEISETIAKIQAQMTALEGGRNSDNPELVQQKEVLRQFLDLTKEENRERQKMLIDSAVRYVDTSDQRLKSVLSTLERLGKHAEVVADANGMLRNVHLIMDDSLKQVSRANSAVKAQLEAASAEESAIARMMREEKLNDANEHITRTDESAVDIANSIGGLTKHSVQIQAYKDTLRNESGSTKRLHLEGVSQMGEQLMSVISAISAAATAESRSLAANNFAKMAEQNQTIISQEVVRNASNIELEANQIAKLVGELQDYGEVLNSSSEIAHQGYGRMRETVDAIRKVSGAVQGAINDLVSDRADAGIATGAPRDDSKGATASTPETGFENPFDKISRR